MDQTPNQYPNKNFEPTNNTSSLDRSLKELHDGNYESFNSINELFEDLNNISHNQSYR